MKHRLISTVLVIALVVSVFATVMPVTMPAAVALPVAASAEVQQAPSTPIYLDTSYSFEERAADLVSRMTLEEKYDQFRAMQPHATFAAKPKAITRLGVKSYGYWGEANHGIYFPVISGNSNYTQYPQSTAIASMWNADLMKTIGGGIADEARVTYNTSCPPGVANPNPSGGACYGLTYFSPNQNLNRDPRWGRADESYSEDPFLTGEVAAAFVTGLQGDTSSQPDTVATGPDDYIQAIATPKHYLANNSEANRNNGTSNITERSLMEYFTVPFAASAGKAGARSVMSAYNAVGLKEDYTTEYPSASSFPTLWSPNDSTTPGGTPGTPAAASRVTLETLLRRSFGFDGYVVSDCDAITRVWQTGRSGHSWHPLQLGGATQINKAQGDAWALKAGTDLDCSGSDYPSTTGLTVSQNQGLVTEADIDIALVRVFTARFQLGEFDPVDAVPYNSVSYTLSSDGDPSVKLASAAHRAVAHESALEAPVLLKNVGALPFAGAGTGRTVALGHVSSLNTFQAGSYSGPAQSKTTFEQALAVRNGSSPSAVTAGSSTPFLSDHFAAFPNVLNSSGTAITTSLCASNPCDPVTDAATAEYQISQADNIVVVVGHTTSDGGEGSDRSTVTLPRMQAQLIRDSIAPLAAKYGKKIAVWIQAKTMVDVSPFKDLPEVGAIVWSSFDGMYQGAAMANLLYNDTVTLEDGRTAIANFSGKLPLTWYSNVDAQLGAAGSPTLAVQDYRMTKAEGAKCGRTYLYYQVGPDCAAPDYVFGQGLSYSPFIYGTPTLSSPTITPDQSVTVSVPVSNQDANHPGKAVVEVYAKAPVGADGNDRPLKQLKGFTKSGLITGTETVQVTIGAGELWFWDDVNHKKVFPTGDWTIMAGPSSADADLQSVTLTVTGQRTAGVEVVSAQPDGIELSLDTPDNRINAQLSVTKHDMAFWDLSDPALRVEYTSSKPSVATVDATGAVAPVSIGTALITAKATANGQSQSTTFPVVVTSGPPDATGSAFPNTHTSLVDFGDTKVALEQASSGIQLSASLFPAASDATYTYQIAPMDTNTADASVTSAGILTASKIGHVRVTVTADVSGVKTSESALISLVAATTTTVTPASVQYSDQVTLQAAVSPATANGDTATGSVEFFVNGVSVGSASIDGSGVANLSLIITYAPGSYNVTAKFTSTNVNFTDSSGGPATLTVTPEDARAVYNGNGLFWTSSVNSTSANVTLSAAILDASALPTTDPAFDPNAGDIRNAKVTFINRETNAAFPGCSNLPVGLVNTGDLKTGTATCNTTLTADKTTGATQYTVGIVVTGYYARNSAEDDTIITVAQPIPSNFITGGGHLVLASSAGQVPGTVGSKMNFGFNVKYTKSGTNLQGNVNLMVRSNGHVYKIKSTALASLGVKDATANFSGKANITDVTDPLNPISLEGNATLQLWMTDNGEPGTSDTLGIQVLSKNGGMWFSSNWSGTRTVEQILGGGNLAVH
jgi:beta-glucosidase